MASGEPIDVLVEVLKKSPQIERKGSLGFKDIVTAVRGTRRGRPVEGRVETSAWPHKARGISGGTMLVASAPAIVARWMALGKVKHTGVLPPEQSVEAAPLFRTLEARGVRTAVAVSEVFPA